MAQDRIGSGEAVKRLHIEAGGELPRYFREYGPPDVLSIRACQNPDTQRGRVALLSLPHAVKDQLIAKLQHTAELAIHQVIEQRRKLAAAHERRRAEDKAQG